MGIRAIDNRLEELRKQGIPIYSISRIDTINRCLYEAYRTYVLNDRGSSNIYAVLGSRVHDVLENIVNGNASESDLLPALVAEFDDLELLDIDFPKDMRGGDSIRQGWIDNMTHFCKHYKSPRKDLTTEELFLYCTPKGRYIQGYIDLQHKNVDGSISIYDYKSSSMYSRESLLEHGRQLVVYKLGKEQEGYDVRDASWIFLKYVDVSFIGKRNARSKERTEIKKTIERRKIGSELAQYIEQDLYELGFDEIDSDMYLTALRLTNDLDGLPEAIKEKYTIKPCVFKYDITPDIVNECVSYIDDTIDFWESLNQDVVEMYKPRSFTKINKSGKEVKDIFFCLSLCGHFKKCPYIKDYLDTQRADDSDDLF